MNKWKMRMTHKLPKTEDIWGHEASDEHTSSVGSKDEYLELSETNNISVESVDKTDLDEKTTEKKKFTNKS